MSPTVEVFKTNVEEPGQGSMILRQIHMRYRNYSANFDLADCDKILRVEAHEGLVDVPGVVRLLKDFGFEARVLSDDIPVSDHFHF